MQLSAQIRLSVLPSFLLACILLLFHMVIPATLWAIGQPYLVKNINPYYGSINTAAVKSLKVLGNNLIFSANDGTNGQELWKSDGTDAGTRLLVNIRPGLDWSSPENLTTVGDKVFFTANDGIAGKEVWVTDGTSSGTKLLRDIYQGTSSSNPSNLTGFNGMLFFTATSAANGTTLWRSDGTPEGTNLFYEFYPGSTGTTFGDLKVINNKLMIGIYTATGGGEIWVSDGTPEGTHLINSSILRQPELLTPCNGLIFFRGSATGSGTELWVTDGTDSGTHLVKDIYPGTSYSSPASLTCVGTTLFFSATDPDHGTELWKSDGTSDGTIMVKDIYSGTSGSSINYLTELNGKLLFQANSPGTGAELWESDGTEVGTALLADIVPGTVWSSPAPRFVAEGNVFLGTSGGLWLTDGTAEGTRKLSDITSTFNFARIGNIAYFTGYRSDVGDELWAVSLQLEPITLIISPQADSATNLGAITISGDAQAQGEASIVLTEVSVDDGTTWAPASGTTSWSYSWSPAADGTVTIRARSTDSSSVTQAIPAAVRVTVDRVPPTASLQINNSATTTTYRTVTLSLVASGTEVNLDCTGMTICGSPLARFSNDGITWSSWGTATASHQWTLDSGDGLKTVYVQVKDRAGNTSDISSTIVLDTSQVPSSTITSPATGLATSASSVVVTGTAAPGPGGGTVTLVEVSADGGSTWQAANGTTTWSITISLPSEGSYTIMSRAWNSTLAEPVTNSVTVRVDRRPPMGTLTFYYGQWTLNATATEGGFCTQAYPSICGFLEISSNNRISWQPASLHPGTGGPLWLRDKAGNVAYITGSYADPFGGPIQMSRTTPVYYSLLQHAYDAALNGELIRLSNGVAENLTFARSTNLVIRGGYTSGFGSVSGATPVTGEFRIQSGSASIENVELNGVMTISGGELTVSNVSVR